MNTKETDFILSDSKLINSKGFKVDVSKGRFERFDANPVMLYNHDIEQVIGRWENRRVENGRLLATPVFDKSDEKGAETARKVSEGFLRGASIGIYPINVEQIGEEYVLTEWELVEASITPIPSDAGAIRLYDEKRETITFEQLKLNMETTKENTPTSPNFREMYRDVCDALGLNPYEEKEIVLNCIETLMKPKLNFTMEKAIEIGAIRKSEEDFFTALSHTSQSDTIDMLEARITECQEDERLQLGKLFRDNEMTISTSIGVRGWREVSKLGLESAQIIVSELPEYRSLSSMVKRSVKGPNGLDWYRKNNPQALREDPELFRRLQEEKKLYDF